METDHSKNKFRWIPDFLRNPESGISISAEADLAAASIDERTRYRYFILLFLLMLPASVGYGFYAFLKGDCLLLGSLLGVDLSIGASLLYLRRLKGGLAVYRFNGVIFGLLLLYVLQTGGANGSKILWMYVYPFLAFFLFGNKEGFFWSLAIFLAAVLLLHRPIPWLPAYPYGGEFIARFSSVYVILHIFAWWFEYSRHHYRVDRNTLELRVRQRTEELTAVNRKLQDTIQEARRLTRRAETASQAKSDFLATMSHEIRTPMNSIIGLSHLALQKDLDDQMKDYLANIHDAAFSLLRIIDEILDFSKIEASKLFLEHAQFNIEEVLGGIANMLGPRAVEKGVPLLFLYTTEIPAALRGDALRLRQILINLIGNAIKFTDSGKIVLSIRLLEKTKERVSLQFSVRDTGIGMTPDQLSTLFQPFTQADNSTTRRFGGTGLGLAICSRLVTLMDGRIRVRSKFGAGSRFVFNATFGAGIDGMEDDPGANRGSLRGRHILVVDPQSSGRAVLRTMLKSAGCLVSTLADASYASALITQWASRNRPVELAVLRLQPLSESGVKAARAIGDDHQLPVVFVAGHDPGDAIRRVGGMSTVDCLIEPVLLSGLIASARKQLNRTGKQETDSVGRTSSREPSFESMAGVRILLVEDVEINQRIVYELLRRHGLQVSVADNGREALKILDREAIDLVFMDIEMPEMDGYQTTRAIRKERRFDGLPIIAVTAHAMPGDRDRCVQAGMNDYISKPILPERLFAVMQRWLGPLNEPATRTTPEDPVEKQIAAMAKALPGFDVDQAMRRLNGNVSFYKELLADLRHNLDETRPALQRLLREGRIDDARHALHGLKGVSGNLGALTLNRACQNLEKILGNSNEKDMIQSRVDAVDKATQSAAGCIDAFLARDPSSGTGLSPGAAHPESKSQTAETMRRLSALLDQGRLDATDCFGTLKGQLTHERQTSEFKTLAEAMRRLDYIDARAALVSLAAVLDVDL